MRIVVTGSTDYFGSKLSPKLTQRDHELAFAVPRSGTNRRPARGINIRGPTFHEWLHRQPQC